MSRLVPVLLTTWTLACGESHTPAPSTPVTGGAGAANAGASTDGASMVEHAGTPAFGGAAGLPEPSARQAGGGAATGGQGGTPSNPYPTRSEVIELLERVNQQFSSKWPDPAALLPGNRPSHIWTRAVYFEGLLALQTVAPRPEHLDYARSWAEFHDWSLRAPVTNADNQCAGQIYFDLFELEGKSDETRLVAIQQSLDSMLESDASTNWTWVDAIQMSMPIWARFAVQKGNAQYLEKMHALYTHTKQVEGGGLYDAQTQLWWRDAKWKPDKALTPNGKPIMWSRGNGWVIAALTRVLARLPAVAPHRAEYEQDLRDMAAALALVQRPDGFWPPNLADPDHFGGPELSGTALFTYALAFGIRTNLLDEDAYRSVVLKAWAALRSAVRDDGFLGYVQSTGDDPSDGQPLSADKQPDFEDFGVGCFLLAGSEVSKLAPP